MTPKQFFTLLCLAMIWGASFMLIRVAVDSFAPVYLIEARVFFAALSLSLIALFLRKQLTFRGNLKHYFIVGFFNSAVPWLLFAYAAQTLTVAMLAILNATAPIWGVLIERVWHGTRIARTGWVGLVVGLLGVILMVGLEPTLLNRQSIIAIAAAALAAVCYGIGTNYARYVKKKVSAFDNSHGSLWATVIILLPLLPFFPVKSAPANHEWFAVIVLGVVCTGVALLFYFRLLEQAGTASALSVTYLIPGFAAIWGYVVLDEALTFNVVVGIMTVVLGTMLIAGLSPTKLFKRRALNN